jgi:alpha-maltose-1-phosphate synthase
VIANSFGQGNVTINSSFGPPSTSIRISDKAKPHFQIGFIAVLAVPRMSSRPNCALNYHPDGYKADRAQVKGRHAAGAGFLKGFIDHSGVDRLVAMTGSKAHFEDFQRLAQSLDTQRRETVWARPLDRRTLRGAGTLFMPGPGFEDEVWNRRLGDERDFSLCGLTHTVASDRVVNSLGRYLVAPTQPWDALICTSTSVRAVVERVIEQHAGFLAERGGAGMKNPVRLPVIPLGVDCDFHAPDGANARPGAALRERLGITENDMAALFLGRLSFHAKAHPTPMLMAMERAAERTPDQTLHLLIVGQFPNQWIEKEFKDAAKRFCQRAEVHILDGANNEIARAAWQAADIFLSLSDNIQESFGLTPIEAMAAGLPCVVSDYNGYKDTVVDGETGFRIPTSAPGPGGGIDIADRYAIGLDTYDRYIGVAALSTMTDIDACANAITRLATDGALRARLGAAALKRARRLYDWRVVVGAYQDLWAELAEIRRSATGIGIRDHANQAAKADFPDPFDMFQGHPTTLVDGETLVRVKSPGIKDDLEVIREGELHTFVSYAFLSENLIDDLVEQLIMGPTLVSDLTAFATNRRKLLRTLGWLGKFDLVEFQ